MRYILILFTFVAINIQAQTVLKFDKRYVECEDNLQKDVVKFNLWLKETKKWTLNNAEMTRNIKIMESELNM